MNYDCIIVFHKQTSLKSYFEANERKLTEHLRTDDTKYCDRYCHIRNSFYEQHDVRLVLLVRYEHDYVAHKHKTMCKINCPINPLPVKGEFEAPSFNAVKFFLTEHGWTETESICSNLLK